LCYKSVNKELPLQDLTKIRIQAIPMGFMDAPPVAVSHADEQRQSFIAVVKDCSPGGSRQDYEKTVSDILRLNGILERPVATSNYSCSFTIKLLEEEKIRLSKSKLIECISPDHSIHIP